MISRQHLRQFLAVVDTGNFTRAADAIGIAQPSLSGGIRELETQVGASLFERRRPTIRLTSAGNRLLPLARRITRDFIRAERDTAASALKVRAFNVGVIPSLATRILAAALGGIRDYDVEITERDSVTLLRALKRGGIDAAIVNLTGQDSDEIATLELWREEFCVLLPRNHPLSGQKVATAEALANEIMIARRACERLRETSDFFTSRGVRPRFSYKSVNEDRALALVAAGLGITVAPRTLATTGTVPVNLADFDLRRTVGVAVRKDDYRAASAYRADCDTLRMAFQIAHSDQSSVVPPP